MQAERQRIFMHVQAHSQAESLRSRANFMTSYPGVIPLAEGFESFSGNINMVSVMFHRAHLDEPPVYTIVLGPRLSGNEGSEEVRSNRRLARLEEMAVEHAREFIASLEHDDPTISSFHGSDNLRHFRAGFSDLNPTDEGFYLTWVAEAFPLPAALLQMIPVYLMATLLLTALFLSRKKYKENPNAEHPKR